MGNASGNPKYHSKASALNIIGDDSWTNLKNKWSNLPDSSVSVHVFYQIIRLSYESAPKNLCERIFLGFVNDLTASIDVSHFLSTLAVVFGNDQGTLMKFLSRVYCNRKHANTNGEMIVSRIATENILKVAYENSFAKEQVAAQLDEIFISESGMQIPSILCSEFEQYSGNVLLLTNWIKSLLYTSFIETYYPSFSNNALTLLDKKYSTSFEIKEFLSKFDDLENKLPICHHIRQLYYSKCQLVLPVVPSTGSGAGSVPSSDMIIQLSGKKIELHERNWLEWMASCNYLNTVVATTIFRLHVNGIKRSWRFYDFAEFCMIFSETNSILDSPDDVSTGASGLKHTSCLFSVEDRVGYICTAFHFRYCAPLINYLRQEEDLPQRGPLFSDAEVGGESGDTRPRASTVASDVPEADASGGREQAAASAVVNKFLVEHNTRARHTSVGVAASVAALDPRTNILQLNYVRDKCVFHYYENVYTSSLILHSSLLQTAPVQTFLMSIDTDECCSIIMKYYMRKMVLSLFCPCDAPAPLKIKRYLASQSTPVTKLPRARFNLFNSLLSQRDYNNIVREQTEYRERVNSRGDINEEGGVVSCAPEAVSPVRPGTEQGDDTVGNDDEFGSLFEDVTVVQLPKDLEDELIALELYHESPSLADYEKLLSKYYDVIPQFSSLSLLAHCEFGLSPSTRQLEKQFITELLLKYQQEHGINRSQPYGAAGTEWCVISKSWFDQWQMFAGQINFPYNNSGGRAGGRGKYAPVLPAVERPVPLSNWASATDAGALILRQPLRYGAKPKIDMLPSTLPEESPEVVQQPLLQPRLVIGQQIDLVPPPVYKALYHWYSNASTSSTAGSGEAAVMRSKSGDSSTRSKSGEAGKNIAPIAASFVGSSDMFMAKCHVTETVVSPEAFDSSIGNGKETDRAAVPPLATPQTTLGVEIYPLIVHIGTVDPHSGKESSVFAFEVMCYRSTPVQCLLNYIRSQSVPSSPGLQDSKAGGGISSLPVPTGKDRLWYCGAASSTGSNTSSNLLYKQHYVLEADHALNQQIATVALNAEGITGRNNARNVAEDYVFMYLLYECEYSLQADGAGAPPDSKSDAGTSSTRPYWPRVNYMTLLQQQEKEDEKRLQIPNIDYNYFSSTASSLMSNVIDTATGIMTSPSTRSEEDALAAVDGSPRSLVVNPRRFLVGLDNLGNTCYMNSSLQVLLHTAPLVDYFLSQMHLLHLTKRPMVPKGKRRDKGYCGELCKLYNTLLLDMWAVRADELEKLKGKDAKMNVCSSISPRIFRKELLALVRRNGNCDSTSFTLHEQHDAQEFLSFLLDALSDDLVWKKTAKPEPKPLPPSEVVIAHCEDPLPESRSSADDPDEQARIVVCEESISTSEPKAEEEAKPVPVPVPSDYIEQPDSNDAKYKGIPAPELDRMLADIWWGNHFKRDISVVQTLFLGQYKSKMHCNICKYSSCRYETFNFLSLPIISPKAPAVVAATESATRGLVLHIVPIKVSYIIQCYVEIPNSHTIDDLVEVAKGFQLKEVDDSNTFEVTEFVKNRICAMYPLSRLVSKIKERACIYLFEIPDRSVLPSAPSSTQATPEVKECDGAASSAIAESDTAEGAETKMEATTEIKEETATETVSDTTNKTETEEETGGYSSVEGEVTGDGKVAAVQQSVPEVIVAPVRLHRVVFTQRRVKLTTIYEGIEKYLIEPFGVPLMVLLPGRVTVGELYDAVSARVNKYLKTQALLQLADATEGNHSTPSSPDRRMSARSRTTSRSSPSGHGLGLGAITASSSAYYAFSSSRKRMYEYKMKMQQQSLEEYYSIGAGAVGRSSKGKNKNKGKKQALTPVGSPKGKGAPDGGNGLSRSSTPQPNFDDSFDYAMSADIGDLASSMEAVKVNAVIDDNASLSTDGQRLIESRPLTPIPMDSSEGGFSTDPCEPEPLIQPSLSLNGVFAGSSINHYGFTIRFIDVAGNNCSLCPWFAKCDGCAIVPTAANRDEVVEVRDGETLAIDWHLAVYEELLDINATNSMKNHESMSNRASKQQQRNQKRSRERGGVSLYACLDKEFREEEDLEDIVCPTCKESGRMKKQFRLHRTPPVLIVQLKRFQYDMTGSGKKLDTHIEFPVDDLDLGNYMGDDPVVPTAPEADADTPNTDIPVVPTAPEANPVVPTAPEADADTPNTDDPVVSTAPEADANTPNTDISSDDTSTELPPFVNVGDGSSLDAAAIDAQYQLYGVIHHIGMLGGGHYIATVRDLVEVREASEVARGASRDATTIAGRMAPAPFDSLDESCAAPAGFDQKFRDGIKLGKITKPVAHCSGPMSVELLEAAVGGDISSVDEPVDIPNRAGSCSPVPMTASTSPVPGVPSPPASPEKKDQQEKERKPPNPVKWFCYNDNIVTQVPQHEVVAPSAYLLFYMRKDLVGVDIHDVMTRRDILDHIDAEFVKLNDLDREILPVSELNACRDDDEAALPLSASAPPSDAVQDPEGVSGITAAKGPAEVHQNAEAPPIRTKATSLKTHNVPGVDGKSAPQECVLF